MTTNPSGADLLAQLARDVISLAKRGGMPDSFWPTDSRIDRACAVLGITPEQARDTDIENGAISAPAQPTAGPTPGDLLDATRPAAVIAEVWTDGACSGNPGPGGWGWVTPDGRHGNGGDPATTNQRMEIIAAIEALRSVPERPIVIVTDSQYVIKGCTEWRAGWLKRGWKNSKGEAVSNRDLWEVLYELVPNASAGISFRWVKGHAGHELNEEADRLAREGIPPRR